AYAPKKKFLTEFPAPEFAWRRILCGLCRAADAAFVLRVNLPGGKFWFVLVGWVALFMPGGKTLFLVCSAAGAALVG
ncbi:hypothetical protein, partial [Streptomyces sp. DH7]|uniref:hypothetical protein n=1 Tax=Streptomyces sp. DH7 TaxID=2857006 RepID=UPI001E45AAB2